MSKSKLTHFSKLEVKFFTRKLEFQDFRMSQVKGWFGSAVCTFKVSYSSIILVLDIHISLT